MYKARNNVDIIRTMLQKKYNKKKQRNETQEGFIALISVSIISAFFIILFIGIFFSATEGMERALDREKSVKALSFSNSCAEIALNELRKDSSYATGTVEIIQDETCEIKDVESYGLYGKVIKTEAEVFGQTKRIQIEVDIENHPSLEIINWREVSDFIVF